MKTIAVLTTGGTIASQEGSDGLVPSLNSSDLLAVIQHACPNHAFVLHDVLNLDSSNIQPRHWRMIAHAVFDALRYADGVVITHGTDTMAYTASALSFLLRGLGGANKSVVLTGSQVPIERMQTDAISNLHTALAAVEAGIGGVTVAFDRQIIRGTRAVKIDSMGFRAFASVNVPPIARVAADGLRLSPDCAEPVADGGELRVDEALCDEVFLLKIVPGTKPEIFDMLLNMRYRGVVLEAYGAGGVHDVERNLTIGVESLVRAGIPVVVCSQCLYGKIDLEIYEVGRKLRACGVIPGADMTTEAAVVKLMWALGKTHDINEIAAMFATNYAGEIIAPR